LQHNVIPHHTEVEIS